jgi:hypothetical protein
MVVAYQHTVSAVFATSFTTTVAFLATALSPIMPISAFGIFAAFAIVANFVLVVSFWPATVLIWEIYFCRAKCVGCCCPCVPACAVIAATTPLHQRPTKAQSTKVELVKAQSFMDMIEAGADSKLRRVEWFFSHRCAPALVWNVDVRGHIKPVSIVLLVLMGVVGILFSLEALQMRPPSSEEQW